MIVIMDIEESNHIQLAATCSRNSYDLMEDNQWNDLLWRKGVNLSRKLYYKVLSESVYVYYDNGIRLARDY